MSAKAIVVKWIPATNYRPRRIKAEVRGKKLVLTESECEQLGHSNNLPRLIAERFRDTNGWTGELIEGSLPSQDYVFVFDTRR